MTFPTAAAMTTRRSSLVERLGAVIAPPVEAVGVWVKSGVSVPGTETADFTHTPTASTGGAMTAPSLSTKELRRVVIAAAVGNVIEWRSEEHPSELQSRF